MLILGWNSVTRNVSQKWDLQNCLWSEGTCQEHKWPQLSATDLQREEWAHWQWGVWGDLSHTVLRSKRTIISDKCNQISSCLSPQKPLETSQRVVSVIKKRESPAALGAVKKRLRGLGAFCVGWGQSNKMAAPAEWQGSLGWEPAAVVAAVSPP